MTMEHPRLAAIASVILLTIAIAAFAQGGSGTELKPGDPAPAFSLACCGRAAFGIVNSDGRRARKRSATWRGVAP